MKNRGQALVLFVLLLPIIILMLSYVINIGYISITKKETDNNIEKIIENSFENNLNETEIKNLIIKNIKNVYVREISKTENNIKIEIKVTINTFLNTKQNTYEKTYVAIKQENEIKIRK